MLTCRTAGRMSAETARAASMGHRIGFVPTMGALHQGHLSLIAAALSDNDTVTASVFVNRAQFNDPEDYSKYPRMPEEDQALLASAGCHILFMPDEKEVFPEGWNMPDLDFGIMETVMEGMYRPGHFKGMLKVVHRLFEIVKPHEAFFGEKDFQQMALIRKMASLLHPDIKITGCPTIREPDGLAMSSRNMRLTKEQRDEAPVIYQTLKQAASWLRQMNVGGVHEKVEDVFKKAKHLSLQYFEIVDADSLQPLTDFDAGKNTRLCIAVLAGNVRLIDNIPA